VSELDEGRVLVVDVDDASREQVTVVLGDAGYVVETAHDGEEAWLRLAAEGPQIDAVLLDWLLPGMSGIELLRRMKRDPRLETIPVILMTAVAVREVMLEAIAAGVYYDVAKPVDPEKLRAVVAAAAEDHGRYRTLQRTLRQGVDAIATLDEARFRYRDVEQASALATLLSQACPDPARTVVGLGELLVNAVEHGNLGITYDEKTRLLAEGRWLQEVDRRLALDENAGKLVEVLFERHQRGVRITIRDQGPGFDWQRFLVVSPDRMLHSHGRGIAMARGMSFDRLEYRPPGNQVIAEVRCGDPARPESPEVSDSGSARPE
jgi:sigma-B regulation protein RsbU (phosphoserine phosphatase)